MAGNIQLEVVTPEASVVSDEAQIVMAPGIDGEFGALIGHTPFMTALKTGAIRYVDSSGSERFVFVSGGFSEVLPTKVTVLAESAERRSQIDKDRAMAAKDRAEKRLAEKAFELDESRARAALERALHRLRLIQV